MAPTNRGIVIAAIVAAVIVVSSLVAPIVVAYRLQQLGLNPLWMIVSPHNAYIAARARRDITWQGLRIRVGAKFVIDDETATVRVHRLDPASPLFFAPAVIFRAPNDSSGRVFERAKLRCRSAATPGISCTIHESSERPGNAVCIERRSHRHPEEFDLWHCGVPKGVHAVYFGSPAECLEYGRIVLDAFASGEIRTSTSNAPDRSTIGGVRTQL
jgi:hypothetical protein